MCGCSVIHHSSKYRHYTYCHPFSCVCWTVLEPWCKLNPFLFRLNNKVICRVYLKEETESKGSCMYMLLVKCLAVGWVTGSDGGRGRIFFNFSPPNTTVSKTVGGHSFYIHQHLIYFFILSSRAFNLWPHEICVFKCPFSFYT